MTHQYTIENSSDTVVVNGELSNYPNTTIGETSSFEFYIRGYSNTHDDAYGTIYGVEYSSAEYRYQILKDYLRYAEYAVTERTESGVYFTEQLPFSRAPIDTLLVSIQPGSGVEEARGVWGIITGGSDSTEVFGARARIDIDVFVLAEYSDYATEQDVRDAFEHTL